MLERWIPWKYLVKKISHSYGFPDPFGLLAKLGRFSQPSEVQHPVELLRAGIVFHTRGLVNTRAIQNNLDWVWPYWVEKQFNPADLSFVPRAYSLTHVNLTQRNWTAVGLPHLPLYPLVDPRGLITPLYDGWSVDFWICDETDEWLLPSRHPRVEQRLDLEPNLAVWTRCRSRGLEVITCLRLEEHDQIPVAVISVEGFSRRRAHLAVSLRPYNAEGVHFIEAIDYNESTRSWLVNKTTAVTMSDQPEKVIFSNYEQGDVIHRFTDTHGGRGIECRVGMATSAALFPLEEQRRREIAVHIPLDRQLEENSLPPQRVSSTWETVLSGTARLRIPDDRISFLYDAAVRTLVLLSAHDIFPGPYTYRRFWFRDACLMINALLSLGYKERAFRLLNMFPSRQSGSGYFKSQEGEWDSNGQVLWIFDRYRQLTGKNIPEEWTESALKGARWIVRKRSRKDGTPHGGLLPAGFSAEHLGPNDYYYWDDFWGLAGLRAAARIAGHEGLPKEERELQRESEDFETTIFETIARIPEGKNQGAMPASPYRRMDSGAVGSLAVDYPLQITPAGDRAVAETVEFLLNNCFYGGGFFQDMIHSGINVYLTLCVAETLLRSEDPRYQSLVESVAGLASPTGQWPEAIHPLTGGGCMGDGQHGWAAAEWVMMMRNIFVREEGDRLIVGSGIFPRWIQSEEGLAFGPTPTPFGDVGVRIFKENGKTSVAIDAEWRDNAPEVDLRIPGFKPERLENFKKPHVLSAEN